MGIKGLPKFLRDHYGGLWVNSHISEFMRKKIAMDLASWLYKYKSIRGDDWLSGFYQLITSFRRFQVHVVFVFDGKPPKEKDATKSKRKSTKEQLIEREDTFAKAIAKYEATGKANRFLLDKMKTILRKEEKKSAVVGSLLHPELPTLDLTDENLKMLFDIEKIKRQCSRMRREIVNITREDILNLQKLLTIFGFPFIQAEGEAEATCSWLCKNRLVDGVISEDTDLLAYSCPIYINKYNTDGEISYLRYDDLLKETGFSSEQLLDFLILCGTDYNPNIPRVGPATAFKLIQRCGCLEALESEGKYDCSKLNYHRGRELFQYTPTIPLAVPYCEVKIDIDKAQEFLEAQGISYSTGGFSDFWGPIKIIFKDRED